MPKVLVEGQEIIIDERMTYAELAGQYGRGDLPVMLVRENGKLSELYKTVKTDKEITFVTTADLAGYDTYRRSCSMLFLSAARKVIGREKINRMILHFSVGSGFYFTIEGDVKVNRTLAARIEKEMRDMVDRDVRIYKTSVRTPEAREIFREDGLRDKDLLFRFRHVSRTNIYELDGFRDYNYGFIAHSTGVLKHFALYYYRNGIVLQMPTRKNLTDVPPFTPMKKLFNAQIEAEKWAEKIHIENIGALNERVTKGDMFQPILLSEAYQEGRISDIAAMVAARKGVKFVMIAGPSSSGKTTFAQRLCIQLSAHGMNPHYMGVDNYFVNREDTPLDENGKKDYECLGAIDVEGFNKDLNDLLAGKEIPVPTFDFQEGKRVYKGNTLSLPDGDILVIEGIHCLNDALTYAIPAESKFRIYISALTQLNIDEHDRIPTTDGRLLRRMVRDNRTRGHSAAATIAMWESVRRGEDNNIFPYQESADVFFNSALPYEIAVIKQYVQPLLYQIEEGDPEYDEARRLLKFLDYVVGIPSEQVPVNSILREFIGGGCYNL